jgi:hypothetical protein
MSSQVPAYPPHSDKLDVIDGAIEALARQYGGRRLIYLSTPITTGRRYYDCLRDVDRNLSSEQFREMHRKFVIDPNIAAARLVRERLAARLNEPVIDPTAIDYPHWNQNDYKVLWARVIECLCRAVALVDGWEYSNGCAFEFLIAVRADKPCMDEHMQPLSLDSGVQLIETAARDIMKIGDDARFLNCVLRDLRSVVNGHHSA